MERELVGQLKQDSSPDFPITPQYEIVYQLSITRSDSRQTTQIQLDPQQKLFSLTPSCHDSFLPDAALATQELSALLFKQNNEVLAFQCQPEEQQSTPSPLQLNEQTIPIGKYFILAHNDRIRIGEHIVRIEQLQRAVEIPITLEASMPTPAPMPGPHHVEESAMPARPLLGRRSTKITPPQRAIKTTPARPYTPPLRSHQLSPLHLRTMAALGHDFAISAIIMLTIYSYLPLSSLALLFDSSVLAHLCVYYLLTLAIQLISALLTGLSLGEMALGWKSNRAFVWNRVGGMIRHFVAACMFQLPARLIRWGQPGRNISEQLSLTQLELSGRPQQMVIALILSGTLITTVAGFPSHIQRPLSLAPTVIQENWHRPTAGLNQGHQVTSHLSSYYYDLSFAYPLHEPPFLIPSYEVKLQAEQKTIRPYMSFYSPQELITINFKVVKHINLLELIGKEADRIPLFASRHPHLAVLLRQNPAPTSLPLKLQQSLQQEFMQIVELAAGHQWTHKLLAPHYRHIIDQLRAQLPYSESSPLVNLQFHQLNGHLFLTLQMPQLQSPATTQVRQTFFWQIEFPSSKLFLWQTSGPHLNRGDEMIVLNKLQLLPLGERAAAQASSNNFLELIDFFVQKKLSLERRLMLEEKLLNHYKTLATWSLNHNDFTLRELLLTQTLMVKEIYNILEFDLMNNPFISQLEQLEEALKKSDPSLLTTLSSGVKSESTAPAIFRRRPEAIPFATPRNRINKRNRLQ